MIQLTDKVWAVEVPDGASNFKLVNHTVRSVFDVRHEQRLEWDSPAITHKFIIFSDARWQYLFTTKGATEEQARTVVKELPVGQRYENYNGDYPVWYHTGKESLQSLLRSKGCDVNKNWAIIQKQNDNA